MPEDRCGRTSPARCELCPHSCGVDRGRNLGRCAIDQGLYVADVCLHRGEEPVLGGGRGVCNVFFAHCNLQCVYCQNHQISSNATPLASYKTEVTSLAQRIAKILHTGIDTVGLVSPTPYAQHLRPLLNQLWDLGYHPTVIYNTNGYDSPQTIRALQGLIDIYLPDYKYGSPTMAAELSGASDYPERALEAIRTMIEQVGGRLELDTQGVARRGILVRHLVLPGRVENSRAALFNLWQEFGPGLPISLMGQYEPAHRAEAFTDLSRRLLPEEYATALGMLEDLGFETGFTQSLESAGQYNPDFSRGKTFDEGTD